MDADILEVFVRDGYVHLPSATTASDAAKMQDRLWALMAEKGAVRNAPETWEAKQGYGLQAISEGDPSSVQTPVIKNALDTLFGETSWHAKDDWGQTLVTLPTSGEWRVPHKSWHFDWHHLRPDHISGVNVFLLVDEVASRGGGTVAISGSPAVTERFRATHPDLQKMSDINKAYTEFDPWLTALATDDGAPNRNDMFMSKDTLVHDTALRVVELTGKAGDVIITHPGLFHTGSQNILKRPRMMRVQRVRAA